MDAFNSIAVNYGPLAQGKWKSSYITAELDSKRTSIDMSELTTFEWEFTFVQGLDGEEEEELKGVHGKVEIWRKCRPLVSDTVNAHARQSLL